MCSEGIERPKPYFDSLKLTLKSIGITRNGVVMVGHTPSDIICDRSADVISFAVSCEKLKKEY